MEIYSELYKRVTFDLEIEQNQQKEKQNALLLYLDNPRVYKLHNRFKKNNSSLYNYQDKTKFKNERLLSEAFSPILGY